MAKQYETRTITHGTSWAAYAKISTSEETPGEIDDTVAPKVMTGLRAVSMETTQESTAFYADNVIHVRTTGAKSTEGTITFYQLPKEFYADHLGYKVISETKGGVIDTGDKANFVFQYITSITDEFGKTADQLHIWYNCQGAEPNGDDTTDEDAIEAKEYELPITAQPNSLVKDPDGLPITHLFLDKTDENADLFDLAYTKILVPKDFMSSNSISVNYSVKDQ